MQKKKQVFTWPISVLVVVVSFLSVLVVLQQVQAAWVGPTYLPGDTSLQNTFVFTPLAQDLEIGLKQITGTGIVIDPTPSAVGTPKLTVNNVVGATKYNAALFEGKICLNGTTATDCIESWSAVSGGSGSSGDDWKINYDSALTYKRPLYYTTTTPASGFVGIGTNAPRYPLEIVGASNTTDTVAIGSDGLASHIVFLDKNDNWRGYIGYTNEQPFEIFGIASGRNSVDGAKQDLRFLVGSQEHATIAAPWPQHYGDEVMRLKANGNVGIGTSTPNSLLHIYKTSANAEIDIQSVAGVNNHWGIYNSSATGDLLFWKGGADRVTFADTGEVGIGAAPNTLYQLSVTASDKIAIRGISTIASYPKGIGVYGSGFSGIRGDAVGINSAGIRGISSGLSGSVAGDFNGDVVIGGGYLQLSNESIDEVYCDELQGHTGRIVIDGDNLYVCIGSPAVWRQVTLN